jgi:hypothetical protein
MRNAWDVGFVSDIAITNPASLPQPFEVRLDLPERVSLTSQIWNATVDRYAGSVTFRGGPVGAGKTLLFGFVANKSPNMWDQRQFTPTGCTVNRNACDGFPPSAPRSDVPGWSLRADGLPQNRMWRFG